MKTMMPYHINKLYNMLRKFKLKFPFHQIKRTKSSKNIGKHTLFSNFSHQLSKNSQRPTLPRRKHNKRSTDSSPSE